MHYNNTLNLTTFQHIWIFFSFFQLFHTLNVNIYITFYNYIVIFSMSNLNDLNLKVPQWHQKESENHSWHNEAEDTVCRSMEVAGLDKHG